MTSSLKGVNGSVCECLCKRILEGVNAGMNEFESVCLNE